MFLKEQTLQDLTIGEGPFLRFDSSPALFGTVGQH